MYQGRVALEFKKEGLSDQEIVTDSVAVVKGELPPPSGIPAHMAQQFKPRPGGPGHGSHDGHNH